MLPGRRIALSDEETRARNQIEQAFARAGLAVPAVSEVLAGLSIEAARAQKILELLLREQVLVRVTLDLVFHRDALARLRALLRQHKAGVSPRISVPAFKNLAGVTRKYAIPLLEFLDRTGVTRREGDERVILEP
jgi:selenocysteine-specific elongation factor